MQTRHIIWVVFAATLYAQITSGIIILLLFTLFFRKSQQPLPGTSGPAAESQGPSSLGFFHRARYFILNNPIMTCIRGEDQTTRIVELLSNHIILGAAYDDSARGYPPRCHPGTRIKILERLTLWFRGIICIKPLLWLCGPAGVGKSAILQTFAETVARPGASVFISRPNKRNNPSQLFPTIASQLAIHIEAYRTYIVDLLALNPYLLSKSMEVQFQAFIIQPFVEKRIGVGHGQRWAILLDGLDELEGEQAQRDVIRLISTFTQEHPDAPLAWIISSRPEPHISDTFTESNVRDSCELEYIPIDSTEATQDVERFIRESFDSIRSEFPRSVPKDWPEEISITRLAKAASGLFIFAETAIRFVKDSAHADPRSRLEITLSSITNSRGSPAEEHPFALLDNLYKTILFGIPPRLWQKTKLLLRLALSFRFNDRFLGLSTASKSRTLRGMAVILCMDRYTVYPSLEKCYSMLGIPSWEEAHEKPLTFLHASFADFLMDPDRSGDYTISIDGVEEEVLGFYLDLWHGGLGPNSTFDDSLINQLYDAPVPQPIDDFHLWEDTTKALLMQIEMECFLQPVSSTLQPKRSKTLRSKTLDALRNINMVTLCYSRHLNSSSLSSFLTRAFDIAQDNELCKSGFLRKASSQDISLERLDLSKQRAIRRNFRNKKTSLFMMLLPKYLQSSLETFLAAPGEPLGLILGVIPEGRIAVFTKPQTRYYYLVPYHG